MRSVKLAIAANSSVFFLKLLAAILTGSASMFAEAVHSFADTSNQFLLWIGFKRSKIGPSEEFPFGRGKEMFVWGLISACGIFFIGAGINIYHGISYLTSPQENVVELEFLKKLHEMIAGSEKHSYHQVNLMVLAISLVIELVPLYYAWKDRHDLNTLNLAVLLEDTVAILGIIFAFIAISLAKFTGYHHWDAIGSITIGILLGFVAIVLIKRNLEFLIEKSSPEELREEVMEALQGMPLIEEIKDVRMIVLTPTAHFIRAEVEINGYLLVKEMEDTLRDDFKEIESFSDFLRFCSAFANRITRIIGANIDKMEEELKRKKRFIRYVDIKPS